MNFDGTFPEKGAAKRLLDNEKTPEKHQPVRVVVSYPQSEEWDGKNTKTFTVCKWLLVIALFVGIAASSVYLYHFYTSRSVPSEETRVIPKFVTSDDDLKKYFLKQVETHYDGVRRELSYVEQLQYFKNEAESLKSNNLTYFINELNIAIPLLLPKNIDIHTSIIENLYNYTHHATIWLEHAVKFELNLMSYDFQKSNKVIDDSDLNKWGDQEFEELNKLREKYTKPMDQKITDNKMEISGTVVVFSDVINLIPGNNLIQQLSIIASILHMDSNFTRNIDLALFADDWRFQFPVTIDLSGDSATPTKLNIKNGKNGASGHNGGYFIAGGKFDSSQISVVSNGGAAAAGHDGLNGRDGIPDLEPSFNGSDSSFPLSGFQCYVPYNNAILNGANEEVQSFCVFNELSCGEEGLRGGKPGESGTGGEIIYFNPNKFETRKGRNGAKSTHGVDGLNGNSASASCFHYMYRIQPTAGTEDIVKTKWTPITTRLCEPVCNASLLPLRKNSLNNRKESKPIKKNLTKLISAFEIFSKKARDSLENENDNQLFLLLENIESNSALKNFTSPILLFDEFNEIEKKYTKVEIFRSFSKKVNNVLILTQDLETKHALEYLQVAIWTKMSFIRSGIGELYIINIDKYLDQLLETVKRLDIDAIKVSAIDDGLEKELLRKFDKIKSSLAPSNELLCELSNVRDSDRRLKCLVSMLSNVVTNFTQISAQILKGQNETRESYKAIKMYVNAYKENMNEHFPTFKTNETSCAEITEDCFKLNTSKSFEKMEKALFKTFEKLEGNDFLLPFNNVVKIILKRVHETRALSPKIYFLIRDFRDAIEDFSALLKSCDRLLLDKLLQSKLEFLHLQKFNTKLLLEKVAITKQKIIESLLRDQYMRALNAYQQWAFPYTDTIEVIPPGAGKQDLLNAITSIKDARTHHLTTINDRDSQIIKAEFTVASTEPFYTWNNKDYNSAIVELLSGREVNLRANLFDSSNIVNKQAIKFRTIELRLPGVPKDILRGYKVHLTHSGYSNYMYNSTAFTIVGPELNFFYSFQHNRRTGTPAELNLTLEKVMRGEIMLSPYTTWTVKIVPNSVTGNFSNLQKYMNITDVHLEGSGSYVQMSSNFIHKTT